MKNKTISILIFLTLVMTAFAIIPMNASAYDFPSTNELNKNNENPLRYGQDAPHVNLVEADIGQVTLEFIMPYTYLACFEYRSDGESSQYGDIYPHPVVTDDFYYYYFCMNSSNSPYEKTFYADEYVEIRLAFGAERDWDFNWTRFDVETAEVQPVGGVFIPVDKTAVVTPYIHMALMILTIIGLLGAVVYYKRK